ncbi:MAG TPA: peptidase T [Vicinamibacterales bacterium]|nr:peptidase T [Vicinamibacterales bacterium]
MRETVLDRFLRYVQHDTRSDDGSSSVPSTPGQMLFQRSLVEELHAIGLHDAAVDANGYVMATIPATTAKTSVPAIGFIAHVDTSPEMSGAGVTPIVHANYDGRDLALPDDPTAVLRLAECPALSEQIGHDIVTASGTTLLGADDKAGVAEIVTAAEYLVSHPEIPHGTVRVGFTPDEEIGRGANHFDVARFGCTCAYTLDGGSRGEVESESFSADAMTIVFHGFNTHPGYAKGKMTNAIKIAADFIHRLPVGRLSPESTDGHDGFVHPYAQQSGVDRTIVKLIIRDFETAGLAEKEAFVAALARESVAAAPGARVEITVDEQYRNMRTVLDERPEVVAHAREAVRRCGLAVVTRAIRGGTDGSRLSFMGLPTPNLFAGEHNFHSRLEWVSRQDMEKAVDVIIALCRVWEERAAL